jgi:hypothetical protein
MKENYIIVSKNIIMLSCSSLITGFWKCCDAGPREDRLFLAHNSMEYSLSLNASIKGTRIIINQKQWENSFGNRKQLAIQAVHASMLDSEMNRLLPCEETKQEMKQKQTSKLKTRKIIRKPQVKV